MGTTDPGDPHGRALRDRARSTYERARWVAAAREALAVVALVAASIAGGTDPTAAALVGFALAIAFIALRARGGPYARAAMVGLGAGAVPLALPLLLHRTGSCCLGGLGCGVTCLVACVGGGTLAGAFVGARALTREARPAAFLASASLVALLAGSLGCVASGTSGVVGMAAALAMSAVPVALLGRARA